MFACTETITIIRHEVLPDSDRYSCEIIEGVSWYSKSGTTASASGVDPMIDITVRIPEKVVPERLPVADDIIVHGTVCAYSGRKSLAGMEYFRVAIVGDNRRGGGLRHVVVKSQ